MPGWNDAERAVLVALLRTRPQGMSWREITDEVSDAGSAREVWHRHVPPALFDENDPDSDPLTTAALDLARWRDSDFEFVTFLDDTYPPRLREIHQFPPVLFTRGRRAPDDTAVSIVGSRRASDRGLRIAGELAAALSGAGTTVISGLAAGIDERAHVAALDAGGRTVAVIGTGITQAYPAANRDLQERIGREGLVMSQFWPDTPPSRQSFPIRNATMSGYGRATVVVEAGETSGARIQARLAVEHGRPVILTDLVTRTTEWGRSLLSRPGVYVASSIKEIADVIDEVTRELGPEIDALATAIR